VLAAIVIASVGVYMGVPVGATTGVGRASSASAHVATSTGAVTALDCNGDSPIQKMFRPMNCTDIRGFASVDNANTWGGKFYDNGQYIGHDEPDATFLSNAPGSGNNVNWNITLGTDPRALPTTTRPGKDISHWFELSPAPWLSMAMCDNLSYPQSPCTPESDSNAASGSFAGGGSAFMEMQFYPPGNAPFVDSESCDNTHWCAALTIDSLECTANFAQCNNNCEEPINFAFIQTDGVPDVNGYFPNNKTLLMNPGDQLSIHMSDAPAPGGGNAFEVVIYDATTHQSGWMQASAANGFVHTSIADCSQTPYNFQPEYNTAAAGNYVPWAALQTDVSTEFETGHFEPCTSLGDSLGVNYFDSSDPDGTMNKCIGPYESAQVNGEGAETGDAMCYNAGDTHPGYDGPGSSTPPNEVTGCQDNLFQNGDLDFDGTPYWSEWPTSTQAGLYPGSFVESLPSTGFGRPYSQYFFQTDVALSESTCGPTSLSGCTVPPNGPGGFYPFWSLTGSWGGSCALEFGNVTHGPNLSDFGGDAEYGTNQLATLGYPEFEGPLHSVSRCSFDGGGGGGGF
jgi:hypothetical protein